MFRECKVEFEKFMKTAKELKEEKKKILLKMKRGNEELSDHPEEEDEDDFKMLLTVPQTEIQQKKESATKIKNLLDLDDVDTTTLALPAVAPCPPQPESHLEELMLLLETKEKEMWALEHTRTTEILNLERALSDKEQERSNLERSTASQIGILQSQISELKSTLESKTTEIANHSRENEMSLRGKEQDISDLLKSTELLKKQISETSAYAGTLREELSALADKNALLEDAQAHLQQAIALRDSKISDLENQNRNIETSRTSDIRAFEDKIADLSAARDSELATAKSAWESEILNFILQDDRTMGCSVSSDCSKLVAEISTVLADRRKLRQELTRSREEVLELSRRSSVSRLLQPIVNCVWGQPSSSISPPLLTYHNL
jgi:hypothetical protein